MACRRWGCRLRTSMASSESKMIQPASGNTIYNRFHELAVASSLDDWSLQWQAALMTGACSGKQPTRVWAYLEGQQSDGMCLFVRVSLQHLRQQA